MADLAASDVTVTIERRSIEGKTRRCRVKIEFGDGALTYPAGGVPMPAASAFGMKDHLDFLSLMDYDDATGLVWKYYKANNKLRAYVQGYAHGTGGAVTLDDYPVNAAFGVTSGISVSLTTGAGAATGRLGALIESASGAGNAPPASTLFAMAEGW